MTDWIQVGPWSKLTSDSLNWHPHNRLRRSPTLVKQGDLEEDDFFDDEDVDDDQDRDLDDDLDDESDIDDDDDNDDFFDDDDDI